MKERMIPWWFRKRDEEAGTAGAAAPVRVNTDFTVVSMVNDRLLRLLRKHLVPGVISGREDIGLCMPKDHGDLVLGICLYDVQENSEIRMTGMMAEANSLRFPPMYLDLYYMVTAYSNIQIRYREEENHRILAKVMQVLHDYPKMEGEDQMHAEYQNLTLEQKMSVWNNFKSGYQLSLFYKVSPVRLESNRSQDMVRVREIEVEANPWQNGKKE